MSMRHRMPDQAVRADPLILFCAECSQKMRIRLAAPAGRGRETRTYECACGHSERINLALPPSSRPRAGTGLSTIRTAKERADPLQPSVREAMLAAVPRLRAFAISLSGKGDRADDLVQETLMRAVANINSFQPGTNMSAWLFTILRNLFRSEYRKRRREVEDADGSYADSLKSSPAQHGRVEFEEFRAALAKLPSDQGEALLLVGASGFSYGEAATICETAVGTIKSRVNRARTRLSGLLAIDGADTFGPDHTTRAVLTARGRVGLARA
jgi:RNA polymerase sigma-70 factor, ECF subfamily